MAQKQRQQPYGNTKVHFMKTQGEIMALLDKHGIGDSRFTRMKEKQLLVLEFTKRGDVQGAERTVAVRLTVPGITDDNTHQMHRALFYYLKSKFESLQFGFVEFVQEFFPHLVLVDAQGHSSTIYEQLGPQYMQALVSGKAGELKMLPD